MIQHQKTAFFLAPKIQCRRKNWAGKKFSSDKHKNRSRFSSTVSQEKAEITAESPKVYCKWLYADTFSYLHCQKQVDFLLYLIQKLHGKMTKESKTGRALGFYSVMLRNVVDKNVVLNFWQQL